MARDVSLTSVPSIFFPRYSGARHRCTVPPETWLRRGTGASRRVCAVFRRISPSPSWMFEQGDEAAKRRETVVHAIDSPCNWLVVALALEGELEDAEPTFLALMSLPSGGGPCPIRATGGCQPPRNADEKKKNSLSLSPWPFPLSLHGRCRHPIFLLGSHRSYLLPRRMVRNQKHGWAVWMTMFIIFVASTLFCWHFEAAGNPRLHELGVASATDGNNMEGKEVRFGIFNSAFWANATTDTGCGAVNSMHDSFTPLGGFIPRSTSSSARSSSAEQAPDSTGCHPSSSWPSFWRDL